MEPSSNSLCVVALSPKADINIGLLFSSKSAIFIAPESTVCPAMKDPVKNVDSLFKIVAVEKTCFTVESE